MAASRTKGTSKGKSGKGTSKPPHSGPFRVAAAWPHQESPFILVKDGAGKTFIATSFSPATPEEFLSQPVSEDAGGNSLLPKWITVLPYEYLRSLSDVAPPGQERPLIWRVKAGLIWENSESEPRYLDEPDAAEARFHLDRAKALRSILAEAAKISWQNAAPLSLQPTTSDDTYLDTARQIVRDITDGCFYQINYLRYFHAYKARGWNNLCALMEERSGPCGCLMTLGSKVIASFSPERFVEIKFKGKMGEITTWPIKGTSPRYPADEKDDLASGERLENSVKDRAELRMIIDLMRNDLSRVCAPASVNVTSDGALRKFSHVWHLEGEVRGILRENLSWRQLLQSLCPGGSITGAPKIAAMERISKDESRERGFFMGNTFLVFGDGSARSSINIRTMFSENWFQSAQYAAGSGIVIKSDPQAELLEIKAKCDVITSAQESQNEL